MGVEKKRGVFCVCLFLKYFSHVLERIKKNGGSLGFDEVDTKDYI